VNFGMWFRHALSADINIINRLEVQYSYMVKNQVLDVLGVATWLLKKMENVLIGWYFLNIYKPKSLKNNGA